MLVSRQLKSVQGILALFAVKLPSSDLCVRFQATSYSPQPIEERARELHDLGLKPLDALHLASAEAGHADFLCTCDDRFLRRAREIRGLATKVISPVELIGELER